MNSKGSRTNRREFAKLVGLGALRAAMEAEGFAVYKPEWWRYDYKDWKEYPILNIGFSGSKAKSRGAVSGARVSK